MFLNENILSKQSKPIIEDLELCNRKKSDHIRFKFQVYSYEYQTIHLTVLELLLVVTIFMVGPFNMTNLYAEEEKEFDQNDKDD